MTGRQGCSCCHIRSLNQFDVKGDDCSSERRQQAGKTTLARVLQEQLERPYYYLAQDAFCHLVSQRHRRADFWGITNQSISALHHTMASFSTLGLDVLVDHVLLDTPQTRGWLQECVQLLHTYPVLFVGVCCPLEELERREAARGDRRPGQARGQVDHCYDPPIYDLIVDTYQHTPEECAEQIMAALAKPANWSAFRRLQQQWTRQ